MQLEKADPKVIEDGIIDESDARWRFLLENWTGMCHISISFVIWTSPPPADSGPTFQFSSSDLKEERT